MLWAMGLDGIFLFAKARMMPVGGLCNRNAQPLRVVQCRAKYIRFSDSARSGMVSIVSINSFSVGATGAAPLRPPPAVITISDAITTVNQPRIDGLYRKKAERNATKKPIEMPQKSRTESHKKAESFGNIKKITYFCISNNINVIMEYLPRIADDVLRERLGAFGAVLIEGPKWTGKTTTAQQQAQSVLKLQDPDRREENLATASTMPSLLLKGKQPRLIDEWQDAPMLWDAVRIAVDKSGGIPGQYILTGSNTVDMGKIYHSGIGRISRMKMFPMSLWESNDSSGEVSLKQLFDNPDYDIDGATSKLNIPDLIRVACRGGWPVALQMSEKSSMLVASDYVNSVCEVDISSIDNKQRNPKIARQIMRSYARNISTLAKRTSILADITSGDITLSMDTMDDYISVLERIFVIQDIDAWCPAIRSKTAIRSMPKRGFSDPSIAIAAMGVNAEGLEMQLKTFGFIFEQMCARDLRAYTPGFGNHLSYYRDRYGLEADLVLHLDDGRYALIECKLGSREIEEGAQHLKEIKRLVQEHNKTEKQVQLREPDLLMVITGGEMAYTRPDGVKVIPLACLKD